MYGFSNDRRLLRLLAADPTDATPHAARAAARSATRPCPVRPAPADAGGGGPDDAEPRALPQADGVP